MAPEAELKGPSEIVLVNQIFTMTPNQTNHVKYGRKYKPVEKRT